MNNNDYLIQPEDLSSKIAAGSCVVADCRFDLARPEQGRQDWLAGHIPGAHHMHLDDDLASPVTPQSGRHPLPSTRAFAATLSNIGWSPGKLLVAYDQSNNAIAARMWWMMRYFGQSSVLLDGGMEAWKAAGLELETGEVDVTPEPLSLLRANPSMTANAEDILAGLGTSSMTLVDARAPQRFSGEFEPLDSKGGHIPGALNRPLNLNNRPDGRFKSPAELHGEFSKALGDADTVAVVHSCGSGVTACHNHFAMSLAGMNPGRVYPGSWSEWIRDPERPVETV